MIDNIIESIGKKWNEQVLKRRKEKGFSQQTFAKAYRERYGSGSQADVSRWERVGDTASSSNTLIGFPEFTTMKRIAELLDVPIGYLIGETDFHSYDIEKVCTYLGITEEAATHIRAITNGKSTSFLGRHLKREYVSALCFLLSSPQLDKFVKGLCNLAEAIHKQKYPINHFDYAMQKISPSIADEATQYILDAYWEDENWVESEEAPAPSQELLNAVHLLRDAMDKNSEQPEQLESSVRLSKYTLLETYFKLVDDIVRDEHLEDMTVPFIKDIPFQK